MKVKNAREFILESGLLAAVAATSFSSGDCPAQLLRTGTDLQCLPVKNEIESWPAIHNPRPISAHAAMCEGSQFSPAASRGADSLPGLVPNGRPCHCDSPFPQQSRRFAPYS